MDLSNGNDRSDMGYSDGRSPHYGTPYPEQQLRFRRSTPVNGARENREAVSETFPFSPIYDNHSPVLPESGYESYTPFPSNVGSTVLYKSPVQNGDKRSDSSEFVSEDGCGNNCGSMTCVKRMWVIMKILLFSFMLAVVAVLCFWCARKSSTFNNLIMKEDFMLYLVVAITAVLAVLTTVLLKNLSSVQSSTTTDKWNLDDFTVY